MMKYIKKFNESEDTNDYFWEISKNEYNDRIYNGSSIYELMRLDPKTVEWVKSTWDPFKSSEIKTIMNITKLGEYTTILNNMNWGPWIDPEIKQSFLIWIDKTDTPIFSINKTKDDWFYVSKMDKYYYQCDQWEGLLKCLHYLKSQHII